MELAAADGKFKGYAKPVMRDVNIYSSEEPEKNPLKRLWEGIRRLRGQRPGEPGGRPGGGAHSRSAARIENPDADLFATIGSVLRNAFVSAFARSLEGSISVRSVRQSLKGVGEDGEKKERKARRRRRIRKTRRTGHAAHAARGKWPWSSGVL